MICDLGGRCREEIGREGVVIRQGGRGRGRRGDCYQRCKGLVLFASQTDEDVTFMFDGAGFE